MIPDPVEEALNSCPRLGADCPYMLLRRAGEKDANKLWEALVRCMEVEWPE